MEKQDFSAGKPEAVAALPESIKNLNLWSTANPPQEGWRKAGGSEAADKVIHLHPHVKFTIRIEIANDIAYGLDRDDALAELGVFGSELDSQNFAQSLLESIQDHLSIRNLKHLSDVFEKALAEEEAHRARRAGDNHGAAADTIGSGD